MSGEGDRRPKRQDQKEMRRALLEAGSIAAGERWVSKWREDLRTQGRPAAGGWPGTMAEARAQVTAYFAAELRRRRMAALTYDELDWAARTTYATAKRDWRAQCEPDTSGI